MCTVVCFTEEGTQEGRVIETLITGTVRTEMWSLRQFRNLENKQTNPQTSALLKKTNQNYRQNKIHKILPNNISNTKLQRAFQLFYNKKYFIMPI